MVCKEKTRESETFMREKEIGSEEEKFKERQENEM